MISGDEVNGSVEASRTSEVRQESAAAESGELFVCRREPVSFLLLSPDRKSRN